MIVAGDLNATSDMRSFRRLLQTGFKSAVEQSGAGLVRTFPANLPIPALVGIDHILTLNSSADGARPCASRVQITSACAPPSTSQAEVPLSG